MEHLMALSTGEMMAEMKESQWAENSVAMMVDWWAGWREQLKERCSAVEMVPNLVETRELHLAGLLEMRWVEKMESWRAVLMDSQKVDYLVWW